MKKKKHLWRYFHQDITVGHTAVDGENISDLNIIYVYGLIIVSNSSTIKAHGPKGYEGGGAD